MSKTVLPEDCFVQCLKCMKAYNLLTPEKIAIQHLNIFVPVKSAQTRVIHL